MIPFNQPCKTGAEKKHILRAIDQQQLCGDGIYTKKCHQWFEEYLNAEKVLLTTSCTHALEMAALMIDIKPGDEVIMPSFTFVSSANAFVLRGAKIVFVDIRPDTMNMDEKLLVNAISNKTVAIVPVHYAGVACEMDKIMSIANQHGIYVIEDAAQALCSNYFDKKLGTIGHIGAFSFHDTKNFTSGGEGGLLVINDPKLTQKAEIIREKGTNRSQFLRGMVDKYSWVGLGSSYLLNELSAAYLYGQLEGLNEVNKQRHENWQIYFDQLTGLKQEGLIELPFIPNGCQQNHHMFYIKTKTRKIRKKLIAYLKAEEINSVFHYVPLHSSKAGQLYGKFIGDDTYTTTESDRLLRLPMFFGLTQSMVLEVTNAVKKFFKSESKKNL